jgi:hypothetical protein
MKRLFNLVGALLCLSGVLHLIKVFAYPLDPNSVVAVILTVVFGLAYLVLGILIFRTPERLLWAGTIIPLVGLVITLIGMKPNPDWFIIAFIVLDVLVIGLCGFMLFQGRSPIRRVR